MVRSTQILLAAVLLAAFAAGLYGQDDLQQQLDNYITPAMKAWDLPGLAIAVVKDDRVMIAKGYGVRQLGKKGSVDKNTLFAVASHTKAFTAAALSLLVGSDRLDWDDAVVEHYSPFQLYDATTTREFAVTDLLTHRAGYRTWAGDLLWWGSNLSREEIIRRYRYLVPDYSFRSRYGYNNVMYVVAGEMIAAITDTSWDDFVSQRLLKPLGMKRSTLTVRDLRKRKNFAQPHTRVGDKLQAIEYRIIDNTGPAGALNSSAIEMAQWLRLQLGHGSIDGKTVIDSAYISRSHKLHTTILPSKGFTETYPTSHFLGYGLGWFLQDYYGRLIVRHSGGMDGMLSYSILVPEENIGVTVLTNSDDQRLYAALPWYVIDRLLNLAEKDWSGIYLANKMATQENATVLIHTAKTEPSLSVQSYAGRYQNDYMGTLEISYSRRTLTARLESHSSVSADLDHWHYDTFTAKWNDPAWGTSLMTFTLAADGSVSTVSFQVRPDFVDPIVYTFKKEN